MRPNVLGRGDAAAVINAEFALRQARFLADAREKCVEPEIVLLAPALERMVMTMGALNSHAEEQLGRVFHLLRRLGRLAIPGDRRIFADLARGRQNFANELIVGLVFVAAIGESNRETENRHARSSA